MTTIYSVMYPTQTSTGTTGSTNPASSTQQSTSASQLLSRNISLSSAYSPSANDTKSWYEAMAKAWGQALNQQAQVITQLSDQVSNAGQDQPSQVTQLTAESMRFSFLATNASTATTSVGEALQTLGRKQ
ncbi:MAG TPA: hypothetical protein VGO18_34655 [Steroidobacteraceae bacterium]|jgi:hypothetical protein|nr:hypothetical protein [Steroidobacteraceae bacterium]